MGGEKNVCCCLEKGFLGGEEGWFFLFWAHLVWFMASEVVDGD